MSDYSELKRLAEASRVANHDESGPDEAFQEALHPEVVLALIAENERLGLELKDFQWGASVEAEAGDEARTEVSKLRAEIAGLKTGYQAYERVNAELKAEVEKVDSDRKACWAEFKVQGRYIDQLKDENDALRKAITDIYEALYREYWSEYAGLDDTRAILDAAIGREEKS